MGGALEIVDGTCGVLVPPEEGALASALDRLISDRTERERLGASGPARAEELCDPGQQLQRIESVLERLGQRSTARAAVPLEARAR
jgi:glycosyltransferase involved in cell wall biosynthesis